MSMVREMGLRGTQVSHVNRDEGRPAKTDDVTLSLANNSRSLVCWTQSKRPFGARSPFVNLGEIAVAYLAAFPEAH